MGRSHQVGGAAHSDMSGQGKGCRIEGLFQRLEDERRAAFISYTCAGDPDVETSLSLCRILVDGGTDLLELGVPFSDPLADGKTNQQAAERALSAGVRQDDVFRLVTRIREFFDGPVIFYTYFNLVFSSGIENYVRRALEAGVDALLCLDLPPEEAGEYLRICRRLGMKTVFIVAPTTPPERLPRIVASASGFIYYVSREGVTGERDDLAEGAQEAVGRIREATDLPVVVGFGISTAGQVRDVADYADGVVVGSALVNCVARNPGAPDAMKEALRAKIRELTAGIRRDGK